MSPNLSLVYETIARHITSDKGQCVLVLGPELSVNQAGQGYKATFREMLPDTSKSKYLASENLFYFHDPFDADTVKSKVIDFYTQAGDQALLQMISRIRFPLIINVCPDKALNNVYNGFVPRYHEGYFTKDSKAEFESLPFPTKKEPVIYNIFGSVDLEQSIILTHSKLYETIEHLLPEKSLPDKIELYLRGTANSYVFLGFKFDSWYYQLICHKLRIKTSITDTRTSLSTPWFEDNDNVSIIMHSTFDMQFTAENPFQCIQNIITACEAVRQGKPSDLRKKNDNGHFSVFVSYARNDESSMERENIVDLVEQQFSSPAESLYQFFRDRRDLQYGDSIDSFMTRIGMGKTVIMVISDKYLKSIYCMKEALRIYRSNDKDHRIFTIVLKEPGNDFLSKPDVYKAYWFKACQQILDDPSKLESEKYDDYISIYRLVEKLIASISDTIYLKLTEAEIPRDAVSKQPSLAPGRTQEFGEFIDKVKNKLKEN